MATVIASPVQPSELSDQVSNDEAQIPSPRKTARRTKGLSLNFPLLIPSQAASSSSHSPTQYSPTTNSINNSPQLRAISPTTSKFNGSEVNRNSTDFLTLLAAQERKVLEMREELQKAETELKFLKKQWTSYETRKKREEAKQIKQLQPLVLEDVSANAPAPIEDGAVDEERRRKRALVERNNNVNTSTVDAMTDINISSKLGRKGSKRIFEGKHTRTLSLLSPTTKPPSSPTIISPSPNLGLDPNEDKPVENVEHQSVTEQIFRPSPLRLNSLNDLITKDGLQIDFGKAYKDFAAHRHSMPQADMFVKQGKQMVEGVKDGFWTFVEDIRQATVGEEAINGTQPRPIKTSQNSSSTSLSKNKQKIGASEIEQKGTSLKSDRLKKGESFWTEFGLETPQKSRSQETKKNSHSPKKDSTDSSYPPELLIESAEEPVGEEDHWDAWESPISIERTASIRKANSGLKIVEGDSLPWPEIQKSTPGKLTRTVSDLMKEWNDTQQEENLTSVGQVH